MIDKRLQAYCTYKRFLRILLSICGCWYMPTKSGKSKKYYWSVFVLLMLIMYTLISLHMSYILRHNLENMMKSIGVALSGFGASLKVISFMINRDSLINYHQTLNDLFEEELKQNKNIRTIIFSSLRIIYTLAYTYFAMLIGLFLAFHAPSYIFIIRSLCHFHLTTNYTLPLSRGFGHFWIVPDNFLYHFHLLFETSLYIFSCTTACSVDSMFGFYIYQFASIMRAMTFKLMNPLSTEKFSDLLKTCVAKHQRLLQCRNTLEHVYGFIVFWHIVTNAILLCAMIYNVMIFSDLNLINASLFLTYTFAKLVQTFTYAWYGTMLTNASEDFRKGIYFGEWPNSGLDRHLRKNVILMLMQKPMIVNALYSPIDIVMFTNSVNATMSYFFLLQSIGDKGG